MDVEAIRSSISDDLKESITYRFIFLNRKASEIVGRLNHPTRNGITPGLLRSFSTDLREIIDIASLNQEFAAQCTKLTQQHVKNIRMCSDAREQMIICLQYWYQIAALLRDNKIVFIKKS